MGLAMQPEQAYLAVQGLRPPTVAVFQHIRQAPLPCTEVICSYYVTEFFNCDSDFQHVSQEAFDVAVTTARMCCRTVICITCTSSAIPFL